MKINLERLMDGLYKVGSVGKSETGVTRIAFSHDYKIGLEVLKNEMERIGLEVRVDAVGNLFGRRRGSRDGSGLIMMGSHLDTVVNGGLYDGALGIAAAMECVRTIDDYNIDIECDIEIVAFNAEAGGPLGGTFGSKVAMGTNIESYDELEGRVQQYGLRKEDISLSRIDYPITNYVELHVEQGNKLFSSEIPIGIVEGIVGITRYQVTVKGMTNHTGTTPMSRRRDSLVGACELITFINSYAKAQGDPFVATVGKIDNEPNSFNVIPGKTTFVVEVRELDDRKIKDFEKNLRIRAEEIKDCDVEINLYSKQSAVMLDKAMQELMVTLCNKKGIAFSRMNSWAGSDAMEVAASVPTAMIFVPSKDGISHNPVEFTYEEDINIGCQLLFEYILQLDECV